jgi:hypothetical protein
MSTKKVSPMPDAPPCPNALERICSRSDTFVERETDDSFVIRCRTCYGINIFPKDKAEQGGRYEAELKRQLLQRQKEEHFRRTREYSNAGR